MGTQNWPIMVELVNRFFGLFRQRRVTIYRKLNPRMTLTLVIIPADCEVSAQYAEIPCLGFGGDVKGAIDSLHEIIGVQWDALVGCRDDELTGGARQLRDALVRAFAAKGD